MWPQDEHSSGKVAVSYCKLSNLPQFTFGDVEPASARRPLPAGSARVARTVAERLRTDARHVPDRNMVYCVGCAHKANGYGSASGILGPDDEAVSWMHHKFITVLSTLGLASSKVVESRAIPRSVSGRSRGSSTGSRDADADEVEALEGSTAPASKQAAGPSMTTVWPSLSLLLGGQSSADDAASLTPPTQAVWFALCDTCWSFVQP